MEVVVRAQCSSVTVPRYSLPPPDLWPGRTTLHVTEKYKPVSCSVVVSVSCTAQPVLSFSLPTQRDEAGPVHQENLSSGREPSPIPTLTDGLQVCLFGAELTDGGSVVDLTHIAPNTRDFITAGDAALNVAKAYLATSPPVIPSEDIELRAPITRMDKVGTSSVL